jgi:uncharacterized protein (TIRG00374 family)
MKKKILITIAKLLVACTLIIFIFDKIDFLKFKQVIFKIDIFYFIIGIIVVGLGQVFISVKRWKFAIEDCCKTNISYFFLLSQYWIGMFLGYFMPASIGWDFYRIQAVYRYSGDLGKNILIVFVEKVISLLGTVIIVIVCYPIIKEYSVDNVFKNIFNFTVIGFISFMVIIALLFMIKNKIINIKSLLKRKALDFLGQVVKKLSKDKFYKEKFLLDLDVFTQKKFILIMLFYAILLRFSSAVANLIFFKALYLNVPLTVNIFVVSLLTIIFLLPISLGSIGIREGAFIVFYGMFGIDQEIALTVSFLRLFAILILIIVGGIFFILQKRI